MWICIVVFDSIYKTTRISASVSAKSWENSTESALLPQRVWWVKGKCGDSGSSEKLCHLINRSSGLRQPQDGGLPMQRGPWHTVGLRLKDAAGCNTTLRRLWLWKANNSRSRNYFLLVVYKQISWCGLFPKSISCDKFLMWHARREARGFHSLARIEDIGPLVWLKPSFGKLTESIRCVSVQTKRSLTTHCESGAQNDHIIFLIHVVSPPLPSRPLFALRNEGYWKQIKLVSPQTG